LTAWGQATDLALLTLAELGPSTAAAVAEACDASARTIARALERAASGPPDARRAHVVGWCHSAPGQRKYPRPVYAVGPGPNRRRPAPPCKRIQHAANARALRQRYQLALQPIHGPLNQKQAAQLGAEMRRRGLL
jgi:hypothetical protein